MQSSSAAKDSSDPSNLETQLLQTPGAEHAQHEPQVEGGEEGEEENLSDDAHVEEEEWDMDPERFRSPCQPHPVIHIDDSGNEDQPPKKKPKKEEPKAKEEEAPHQNLETKMNEAEAGQDETDAQQELTTCVILLQV